MPQQLEPAVAALGLGAHVKRFFMLVHGVSVPDAQHDMLGRGAHCALAMFSVCAQFGFAYPFS
jgi:hypothetical protein